GDGSETHQTRSGGRPREGFLADTRWSNQGWVGCELQMPEDLAAHLALRESGNDPQRPLLTERAARHVKRQVALEQPHPVPARRPRSRSPPTPGRLTGTAQPQKCRISTAFCKRWPIHGIPKRHTCDPSSRGRSVFL